MNTALLKVRQLTLARQKRLVLQEIDLHLDAGEIVGLIGANGAGKSTLLKACLGLLPTTAGSVCIAERELSQWPRDALAREIAYLAQGEDCCWPMPVRQVVSLGRLPYLGQPIAGGEKDPVTDWAMAATDTTELADKPMNQLSGGEQARVMLARTLAVQAPLMLIDEPINHLDPYHQLAVMEIFQASAKRGAGILVTLHDLTLAARYCDRLILLNEGRVLAQGHPREVLCRQHIQQAYRINALLEEREGDLLIVPWTRHHDP